PEPLRQASRQTPSTGEKTINSPVILLKPTGSPGVMMGGKTSALAAGVCGALFVGYCIYFDRKRRSDPNFKNRLRERRRKMKVAKERAGMAKLPDLKDAEAVQKFFLEEIQLGEELLAQGDYEKGVDHLTNAIAGVWSASAAVAGAAADSATACLPDAAHQTAQHQPAYCECTESKRGRYRMRGLKQPAPLPLVDVYSPSLTCQRLGLHHSGRCPTLPIRASERELVFYS
ncbi:Mitochondrial import receptor subunit TOM20-like protein, partial [Larimichthys crocea]